MVGIYKITNKLNGKCYIGQSIDINRRFKEHIRGLNTKTCHNSHFQGAWDMYGSENFEFEIIEEVNNANYLDEREIYYISLYNSNNPTYGYNMTGGGGNLAVNDEFREKLSMRARFNNSAFSEEDIRHIKLSMYCLMDRGELCEIYNTNGKILTQISMGRSYNYIYPELNEHIHNLKQKLIDERNLSIIKSFDNGNKISDICKEMDLSTSIVEKCIYKYRMNKINKNKNKYKQIYNEVFRLHNKGINNYTISKILNISPSTVGRYLTNENNPYRELPYKKVTKSVEKEIISLYFSKNMTIKEISKLLKITDTTVRDYINKYKYANTEVS